MAALKLGLLIFVTTAIAGVTAKDAMYYGGIVGRIDVHDLVSDALDLDREFAMGSESDRRQLAAGNYISYGALNRDRIPCSRRGSSYYNCRGGRKANPYTRSCTKATRCARNNT